MSNKRADVYFFAHHPAFVPYYDLVEEVLNPHLALTQEMMVDLVAFSLEDQVPKRKRPAILVIGSGTGGEVLRLARRLPPARLTAVDFAPSMNAQLKAKYRRAFPKKRFERSVDLMECDFLGKSCAPNFLLRRLRNKFGTDRFDCVVIGFVTHHYTARQKLEFYKRAKSVLKSGGTLVHADLFSYDSKWLSVHAHELGERWIKQLTTPPADWKLRLTKIGHLVKRLRKAWVKHWNTTHKYAPVSTAHPYSSKAMFPDHVAVLRRIGFSQVECPLRIWEVGIIWARL